MNREERERLGRLPRPKLGPIVKVGQWWRTTIGNTFCVVHIHPRDNWAEYAGPNGRRLSLGPVEDGHFSLEEGLTYVGEWT